MTFAEGDDSHVRSDGRTDKIWHSSTHRLGGDDCGRGRSLGRRASLDWILLAATSDSPYRSVGTSTPDARRYLHACSQPVLGPVHPNGGLAAA